ncbi:protoglobin domain-containing protein [Actinomadura madurae]|uniref:protoglobin domain-containing protein n=1 Tax=Actinomadura madurae TaxID=1993 RepID=UPI0020D21E73|nr:protoglobin domain-containing protein [Actinomadura madurae]MCP9950919.1 protoglobin domain-containing protein [Actinomadura madurae]MCP9967710.1 protoglobin domain-containing protein [Actinomadura madurae]MCP9980153.1 protoglobin domain-containing protein [Actinomadura madurae]MCQ0008318.1 protoglobin domain-containing protein [Actinomadura madurae]MCQ0016368.1 protoglobin domain-containing protein [Actinomadura madurae]
MTSPTSIPGYDHDDPALDPSPVTPEDLRKLQASVLFGPDDQDALRTAGEVLRGQVEQILDVWYGFVGSHPHLLAYFSTPSGEPIDEYLARVRPRFGQWIIDTCTRPYDERWLAYQQEIALRHTRDNKNKTDQADSVPHIPLRYLVAFIYPITATMRPFLAAGGHDDDQVEAMFQAWFKTVTLQIALWSQPYAGPAW